MPGLAGLRLKGWWPQVRQCLGKGTSEPHDGDLGLQERKMGLQSSEKQPRLGGGGTPLLTSEELAFTL